MSLRMKNFRRTSLSSQRKMRNKGTKTRKSWISCLMALMLTCSIILSIYTTAKDVWDTVQPLSEGIEQVRVNKMQYFVQQYEHFYFKTGESLNNVMSIFQKLLNALKLYKRVYLVKESHLKFLRWLPESGSQWQFLWSKPKFFNECCAIKSPWAYL